MFRRKIKGTNPKFPSFLSASAVLLIKVRSSIVGLESYIISFGVRAFSQKDLLQG